MLGDCLDCEEDLDEDTDLRRRRRLRNQRVTDDECGICNGPGLKDDGSCTYADEFYDCDGNVLDDAGQRRR